MHEFLTILNTNLTYTRFQIYRNMVDGEHSKLTFKVDVVVVLLFLLFSFDVSIPQACILVILYKWFVHIYLNGSYKIDITYEIKHMSSTNNCISHVSLLIYHWDTLHKFCGFCTWCLT